MSLLSKTLKPALCFVSSVFRYTYFFGNAIIVTSLLDQADERSHSHMDAVIQCSLGLAQPALQSRG